MRDWLTYIAAFLCGLGAAYVVARLNAEATMTYRGDGVFLLGLVGAPLAGMALFALVYGLITGRALRGRFWIGGVVLCAVVIALGAVLIFSGVATLAQAAGFVFLAIFFLGRLLVKAPADA